MKMKSEEEVGRERKMTRESCRMEEMSIWREIGGQGEVRKKSSDSGPKIGNRESVRKIEIKMVGIQNKAREEDDRKMMGKMESMSLATTLKRKVNEIKQQEDRTFSKMTDDKVTGHVEGLVMGFERMMASGDDLQRIRELRFRESLETSYQSPEKSRGDPRAL